MNGLIIHRRSGKEIPPAYLEKACAVFPNGFGIMHKAKQGLQLSPAIRAHDNSAKDIQESLSSIKDEECLLFLRRGKERMGEAKNMQPLLLLQEDDSGRPALGLMAGGNFDHFRGDLKYDPQVNLVDLYLHPLCKLYMEAGYGGDDIVLDDIFATTVRLVIRDSETCIAIMSEKGMVQIFGQKKHKHGREFSFGWTANALGYDESKKSFHVVSKVLEPTHIPQPVPTVLERTVKEQGKLNFKAASAMTPAPISNADMKAAQLAVAKMEKGDKAVADKPTFKQRSMTPPAGVATKNQKHEWYRHFSISGVPDGYKNKTPPVSVWVTEADPNTPIPVKRVQALMAADDKTETVNAPAAQPTAPVAPVVQNSGGFKRAKGAFRRLGDVQAEAQTQPQTQPAPAAPEPKKEEVQTPEQGFTIPKKSRDVVNMIWRSEGGKPIDNPKDVEKVIEDMPMFAEQCGLEDIGETLNWSYAFILRQVREHPEAIAALWFETKDALISTVAQLQRVEDDLRAAEKLLEEKAGIVTIEPEPEPEVKPEPVVAPKPVVAPAATGGKFKGRTFGVKAA